jgi:hypothetical protein
MAISDRDDISWGRMFTGLMIVTLLRAIGYTLFIFGFLHTGCGEWILAKYFGINDQNMGGLLDFVLLLAGYIIAVLPAWFRIIRGGLISGIFNPTNYVVITTYSDGSKESDFGAESNAIDAMKIILGLVVGFFAASVVTLISTFSQWVYMIYFCVKKGKAAVAVAVPSFIILVAWFLCAPFVAIQLAPRFQPYKYDTELMTGTLTEANNYLSANSYSYNLMVRNPKEGESGNKAVRYLYEAEISFNKNTGVTTIDVKPRNERSYNEFLGKKQNKVPKGTYSFKDGEMTSDATITDEGIRELKSLMLPEVIAQMEKLVASKSVRETLWGRPTVDVWDNNEDNKYIFENIKNASQAVQIFYIPFLNESNRTSIYCYHTSSVSNRPYYFSGRTGTGKAFYVKDKETITYR